MAASACAADAAAAAADAAAAVAFVAVDSAADAAVVAADSAVVAADAAVVAADAAVVADDAAADASDAAVVADDAAADASDAAVAAADAAVVAADAAVAADDAYFWRRGGILFSLLLTQTTAQIDAMIDTAAIPCSSVALVDCRVVIYRGMGEFCAGLLGVLAERKREAKAEFWRGILEVSREMRICGNASSGDQLFLFFRKSMGVSGFKKSYSDFWSVGQEVSQAFGAFSENCGIYGVSQTNFVLLADGELLSCEYDKTGEREWKSQFSREIGLARVQWFFIDKIAMLIIDGNGVLWAGGGFCEQHQARRAELANLSHLTKLHHPRRIYTQTNVPQMFIVSNNNEIFRFFKRKCAQDWNGELSRFIQRQCSLTHRLGLRNPRSIVVTKRRVLLLDEWCRIWLLGEGGSDVLTSAKICISEETRVGRARQIYFAGDNAICWVAEQDGRLWLAEDYPFTAPAADMSEMTGIFYPRTVNYHRGGLAIADCTNTIWWIESRSEHCGANVYPLLFVDVRLAPQEFRERLSALREGYLDLRAQVRALKRKLFPKSPARMVQSRSGTTAVVARSGELRLFGKQKITTSLAAPLAPPAPLFTAARAVHIRDTLHPPMLYVVDLNSRLWQTQQGRLAIRPDFPKVKHIASTIFRVVFVFCDGKIHEETGQSIAAATTDVSSRTRVTNPRNLCVSLAFSVITTNARECKLFNCNYTQQAIIGKNITKVCLLNDATDVEQQIIVMLNASKVVQLYCFGGFGGFNNLGCRTQSGKFADIAAGGGILVVADRRGTLYDAGLRKTRFCLPPDQQQPIVPADLPPCWQMTRIRRAMRGVSQIAIGDRCVIFRDRRGQLQSAGLNAHGQLADGKIRDEAEF